MPRTDSAKQVNFVIDEDLADELAASDNKTRTINDALRAHFAARRNVRTADQRLDDLENQMSSIIAALRGEGHSLAPADEHRLANVAQAITSKKYFCDAHNEHGQTRRCAIGQTNQKCHTCNNEARWVR